MNTSVFGQVESALEAPPPLPGDELDDEPPPRRLEPGTCIHGKYTVNGVLGHGGFAVVYDAKHDGLGRRLAIKVLHLRRDTPLALLERFRREARISALVSHPNVLEVYDTGALSDGSPYLVMERVNGENLSTMIRRGPLPIATAVEIGRQLLRGLAAIAEQGITHRDIKPDNLMLHDAGEGTPSVKLVDFGISKCVAIEPQMRLTCHGALVGTPQYMAPEQIRGEEVDVRTDLYATGAVLYEALSGHAPHESQNFSELVVSVLSGQVRPLRQLRSNCPVELERIILKALARQPSDRYASPGELLAALDTLTATLGLPRGAEAFGAEDVTEGTLSTIGRVSLASVQRSVRSQLGSARRPLQLTLLALLFGTPAQVTHVHGEPARSVAEGTQSAAEFTVSSPAALAALVEPLAEVQAIEPLQIAPSSLQGSLASVAGPDGRVEDRLDAPAEFTAIAADSVETSALEGSAEAARDDGTTPHETDRPGASESPRDGASGAVQPASSAHAPASAASKPEAVIASEPPVVLDASQRQRFEQTMQTALAALVRGRLDAAKQHYTEAARIAPREPSAFRGLGLVAARLHAPHEARAALRRYLELAPDAADVSAIEARLSALQ